MQNNRAKTLSFKKRGWVCLFSVASSLALAPTSQAADLLTLFTTPQERQIINANRYKTDKVSRAPKKDVEPLQIRELIKEEVKKTFVISGITVSNEGQHSVWINNQVYQDGEQLEGKSRVQVVVGKELKSSNNRAGW